MVQAFDAGDAPAFFALWKRYVPGALLGYDLEAQKREFYLHVYFAIYPLLASTTGLHQGPGSPPLAESMAGFKAFLESRGQTLASQGEFLAFYALPYIPAPASHPSFEHLFTLEWVTTQRMTLENFLQGVPTHLARPKLYAMLDAYRQALDAGGTARPPLQLRVGHSPQGSLPPVEELEDGEGEPELRAGPGGGVDARGGGESPTSGGPAEGGAPAPGLADVESSSMRALSTGQGSRSDVSLEAGASLSASQSHVAHPKEGRPESPLKSQRSHSMFHQPVLPALDYPRLKEALLGGPPDLVARLLQALRWRVQKSPAGPDRQRVLATYIEWDLLAGQNPTPQGSLLQVCAASPSPAVALELCRLLSSFASQRAGRHYLLLPGAHALPTLLALLQAEGSAALQQSVRAGDCTKDSGVQQQALACLQKLSLHRAAQQALTRLGCLPWLLAWLQGFTRLADFSIEYGLALVMNLCLRPEGRLAAEGTACLALLEHFVESENPRVRTYVNGTLYSLFHRPALRAEAQARGYEELLRAVALNSSDTFAKQIKYILAQLHSAEVGEGGGAPSVDSSASGVRGEEEEGWEGEELEEEAEVEVALGESKDGPLAGERLLCGEYLASVEAAQTEVAMLRSSIVLKDLHQPMDSFWGRTSLSTFRRSTTRLGPLDEVPLQRPTTPTLGRSEGPALGDYSEGGRRKGKLSLRASTDAGSLRGGTGNPALPVK